MKTVLVASTKGGVGKTTLATHLAAHAALDGHRTVLVDADPQGSSTRWAERRADLESAVLPVDGSRRNWAKHIPDDAQRIIVDAPAGSTADSLEPYLDVADGLVVPVLPSTLDIDATVPFLNGIAKHPRVRRGQLKVALVGNRLRPWTNASQQAVDLLKQWPYPVVAELRDSQAYVMLVGLGRSLFDYHSQQVREHQEDWAPLLKWVKKGEPGEMSETALEAMRRQARWVARLLFLSLLPGGFTGAVTLLAPYSAAPFVAWCAAWWWPLLFAGGVLLLFVGSIATWVAFRCPECRFRLSRGPVKVTDFMVPRPAIRFCPHCGVDLSRTPARR